MIDKWNNNKDIKNKNKKNKENMIIDIKNRKT